MIVLIYCVQATCTRIVFDCTGWQLFRKLALFLYCEKNSKFHFLFQPNHSIAFFSRGSDCQLVIRLLHQRILFSKRLRVEYAPENLLRRLNCHTVQDASLQQ